MTTDTTLAAQSTRAIVDRVRDVSARGGSLRIVGQGTWLDAGRPVRATETLTVREHSGIVDYVPGDLTLTARAGTTFAEIRDATAAHNQWLAMDPAGSDTGTIGATIATASAGPLSSAFGLPRDLVLGVEFVTGAGSVVRGGGRVVKNVAGFDLTRLITGAWGTLGVITEVTVRLHARPGADETCAVRLAGKRDDAARVRQFLRRVPFTPYACELLDASTAGSITGEARTLALFRLGGNPEAVRAQRTSLRELGDVMELGMDVWTRLRAVEPERAIVFRMSQLPSKLDDLWSVAVRVSEKCPGTIIHARPARGLVRCIVPQTDENGAWLSRHFAERTAYTRTGERMPAELWAACSAPPTTDPLSRGIKATFDPNNVFNPGIFGE